MIKLTGAQTCRITSQPTGDLQVHVQYTALDDGSVSNVELLALVGGDLYRVPLNDQLPEGASSDERMQYHERMFQHHFSEYRRVAGCDPGEAP